MQIEYRFVLDFQCFSTNNFQNNKYPQKQDNINNSNFLWHNGTIFFRDDARVNILLCTKDGYNVCYNL